MTSYHGINYKNKIPKTIPISGAVVVDAVTTIKPKPRVIAVEPLTNSQSHCHGVLNLSSSNVAQHKDIKNVSLF